MCHQIFLRSLIEPRREIASHFMSLVSTVVRKFCKPMTRFIHITCAFRYTFRVNLIDGSIQFCEKGLFGSANFASSSMVSIASIDTRLLTWFKYGVIETVWWALQNVDSYYSCKWWNQDQERGTIKSYKSLSENCSLRF